MLCIHSVCVAEEYRRKGIATGMLLQYVTNMEKFPFVKIIALISKAKLIQLYESAGFKLVGPSDVVWGKEQWFELRINFNR